ncbi:MAG: hypothetical protein BroJett011_14190 [Chloroflexota bacterium]|nr:MAG: hypothetical protein BroJett011_14190 [Chloroflexota bacterium]
MDTKPQTSKAKLVNEMRFTILWVLPPKYRKTSIYQRSHLKSEDIGERKQFKNFSDKEDRIE